MSVRELERLEKTPFKNPNSAGHNKRCAKCQLFIFMFTASVLLVLCEVLERSHVTSVSKDTQETSVRGKSSTVKPEQETAYTYVITYEPYLISVCFSSQLKYLL